MWNTLTLLAVVMILDILTIWTDASPSNNIKISRPPKDYFPKSGSLQLICEAEGNPMPTVTWYDAQTMTPVEEEKSIDLKLYRDIGLLMIQNPAEKEIYEFYCNASNKYYWAMSNTVKTGRAFLTPTFRLEPLAIQVIKPLQTILFSCIPPIGIPYPKVHWLKDRRLIIRKTFSKDTNRIFFLNSDKNRGDNDQWSLKITKSKPTDSGRYQCVATNDYGRVESSVSWLIVANGLDTIFNTKIEMKLGTINSDVIFSCDQDRKVLTNWISSKDMSLNTRVNVTLNALIIKDVTVHDKGIYACQTNSSNPKLLRLYRLQVGSPDVIEEKSKARKKVVIEGVNVILECDLENSQTEFYWETPNSQPIFPHDLSHSRIQVSSNGNLNIKNVQSSDSGKYTCNAHSSLDVAHKSIWLEVSKHQLDSYPVISIPCQNLTVERGANINLRCEVIGEDIIKIIWYKGINIKQRLISTRRISFPSKDSLMIIDSDPKEDTNFYACEAINDQGRKATWTSFVDVMESYQIPKIDNQIRDLPLPPVVESPKNIKSTSIDLSWSSVSNPEMETLYWVEYVYFGANSGWSIYAKDWKDTTITIENLSPNTWYQFLVRSKTKTGIGRASVPTEYVKTTQYDKHSGDVGFSFSKIKLHNPIMMNDSEMKLIWSLNRMSNDDKSPTVVHFYFLYKPVSILQCIVAMSNGHEYQTNIKTPSLNDYCGLTFLNSEKLKFIKNYQSPGNASNTKLPIDFRKINLTISRDLNYDSFGKMAWMLPNLRPFNCLNISIISERNSRSIYSNYRLLLTPERRPGKPPGNVQVNWALPEVSISINWNIPDRKHWNGILTGTNVYMKSNESEIVLKYNDSQPQKLIKRVNADVDWVFHITLTNCAGESDKSESIILKRWTSSFGVHRSNESIFKKSWMIATLVVTSLLIWLMLCFLTVYLCCIRSNGIHHHKHDIINNTNQTETMKSVITKETFPERIVNHIETEKILPDCVEDKSSSNNCASSAKSSGQSSSPSSVSFCNPYASTQLFDGVNDNKSTDLNLFYLSTPIFEPLPANNSAPAPLNYYLSHVPEWVGNPILSGSFQQNPKLFPFHFPNEFRRNSNDSDSIKAMKTHIEENGVVTTNGTISNLLVSTAPFSDQFSASSKGKSTPNSSNSDSTNPHIHMDSSMRYGLPNIPTKPNRRRQDLVDLYDQSTEMTHLLIDNNEKSSPCNPRVYDIPYSESSVDSRKNSQTKE